MDLLHSLLSNIWAAFLVIFFFGSSIFVHELGHFLAARRRGLIVERFSIGMGPPMFKWRARDGVEYWLAWLPLGGYVKLPQLADLRGLEGENTIDPKTLPDTSYSTKVLVFIAGAVFNVIFAFFLATILWAAGTPTDDFAATTRVGYVFESLDLPDHSHVAGPAFKAGLHAGDEILAVDGNRVTDWSEVRQGLALGSRRTADGRDRLVVLTVKRGGQTLDININPIIGSDEHIRQIGVIQAEDFALAKIPAGSAADKAGFRGGDRIESVDTDIKIYSTKQLSDYFEKHPDTTVTFDVLRAGQLVHIPVPPHTSVQDLFRGVEPASTMRLVHENPLRQIQNILNTTFKSLGSLINPHSDVGLANMSGPIGIVRGFWDAATSEFPVRVAIWFTILINISLAVFNLLPIPVLDGGHIMFATIGKLRGRALPPDFIATAQSVFVVLLFSMVIYISYFDVRRIVRDHSSDTETPVNTTNQSGTAPARPAK
ncbi:MAG TPA: RIP metalloprotease RseP [Opitutaceae bacterium]